MASGSVTYVGHATTLIEVDGTRLLTDPVLRGRIGHIRRIAPAPAPGLSVDGILVSHAHHEQLDLPSLRGLTPGVEVVVTEAVHDDRRMPLGRGLGAVGYLVTGSARVYFAGDTDVFDGMRDLAPGLDVALLPVAGWGSRVPAGHLDPRRAAEALALLRPRFA